jgi:hypothetical protein
LLPARVFPQVDRPVAISAQDSCCCRSFFRLLACLLGATTIGNGGGSGNTVTALTYRKISKRHGGAVQGLRFWIATPTPVGLRAKAKALALGLCRGRGPPKALGLGPWAAAAGQAQGQGLGLRANRRGGGCQKRESELGAWASLTKGVPRRRRPRTGIPRRWTSFPAFGGRFRARGGGSGGGPGGPQTLYNYIFFIDVQTSTTYPYTSVPRPL